nr:MAG TPA: Minor structural protein putative tail fiber [Caudoviricetes sp.]
MADINQKDWDKIKDVIVSPYYNDGYGRYDLSLEEVARGLQAMGYDLNGGGGSTTNPDESKTDTSNYKLELLSTNGTQITDEGFYTTLYVKLYKNNEDVTDITSESNFKWTRFSGNSETDKLKDAAWNLRYAAGAKEILVTREDVNRRALFQCQYVQYEDEVTWVKNAYSTYVDSITKN